VNVAGKSCAYLTEGRVTVLAISPDAVVAEVEGSHLYVVRWSPAIGWTCTCPVPAATRCSHRAAVQTVTCRAGVVPATNQEPRR